MFLVVRQFFVLPTQDWNGSVPSPIENHFLADRIARFCQTYTLGIDFGILCFQIWKAKKIYLEKILSITISFIFSSIWYRLNDVLKDYDLKGIKHVQFEGYDEGSDGSPYGASIPIEKVMYMIWFYHSNFFVKSKIVTLENVSFAYFFSVKTPYLN